MRRFALPLLLALLSGSAWAQESPELSNERVVFHTVAGDLVFVLYPKVAPKTVEQFLKLARAGVYDTTAFVRLHPGFVAQLSTAEDRTRPFTPAQAALIHKLPAEFSALKHDRGVLSMAREDNDPNSASTSFSILLGPAPHLDGKYTIFGELEQGFDVLDEMLKVPADNNHRPVTRLEVTSVGVAASAEALAKLPHVAAHPVNFPAPAPATGPVLQKYTAPTGPAATNNMPVAVSVLLIVLISFASFLLQGKVRPAVHSSLLLINMLIGSFVALILLLPAGQQNSWLALALFAGQIGVFKALGKFETSAEK